MTDTHPDIESRVRTRGPAIFVACALTLAAVGCSSDRLEFGWQFEEPQASDTERPSDTAQPSDTGTPDRDTAVPALDTREAGVDITTCETTPNDQPPLGFCGGSLPETREFGWEEGHTSLTGLELGPTGCPRLLYEQGERVEFAAWNGGSDGWTSEVVARNQRVSSSVQLDSALAVDDCGRPSVAYVKEGRARFATRIDGEWRSEPIPEADGIRKLDLAYHPTGLPAVVFLRISLGDPERPNYELMYGLRNSDRWRVGRIYASDDPLRISKALAFGPSGSSHVTFLESNNDVVYHAIGSLPDSWEVEKTIRPFQAGMVNLAVDSQGDPHIVACPGPGGAGDPIRHLYKTFEGWRAENIVDGADPNPYCHTAAVDRRDRLHTLVLKKKNVRTREIHHAVRTDDGWQTERLVSGRYLRPAPRLQPAPGRDGIHTLATGNSSSTSFPLHAIYEFHAAEE